MNKLLIFGGIGLGVYLASRNKKSTSDKEALANQIILKYTIISSPDYIFDFPYTKESLLLLSVPELEQILANGQLVSIGATCSEYGAMLRAGSPMGGKGLRCACQMRGCK
jgi:hypothetical protein